jgi:tRNA(Ile)-lysidine synthase
MAWRPSLCRGDVQIIPRADPMIDSQADFHRFGEILSSQADLSREKSLAVALSGGADSLALTHLLARYCAAREIELHALIVDHRLRAESTREAEAVSARVAAWQNVVPAILTRPGDKPARRVQEIARAARYALMAEYCGARDISFLFLGHHGDDQMETVLLRLAGGSGIEGLGGMRSAQPCGKLTLLRPLLGFGHEDLTAYCRGAGLEWIEDPTNGDPRYARTRLRAARDVLQREGLTRVRAGRLAARLDRANAALESYAEEEWRRLVSLRDDAVHIDLAGYNALPDEIAVRLMQKALRCLTTEARGYAPALARIEAIAQALRETESFRAATLAGCIIRRSRSRGRVEIRKE